MIRTLPTALFCALLTLAPAAASAQQLDWDSLDAHADRVWREGAGRAMQRAEAGLIAQRNSLPTRWQNIQVTAQIEAPAQGAAAWDNAEHVFNALATVQLGTLPDKRAALLERQIASQRAAHELERWRFVEEIRLAYHAWWLHAALVVHLEEDLATKQAELEPLRQAAQQQLISELELLDLEAELGQVSAEVADAARMRDMARAQLTSLLGPGFTLGEPADLHALDLKALEAQDPWTTCLDRLESHPALRALKARQRVAFAEAAVWDRANPWQLQLGPQVRTAAFQDSWAAAYVSVIIPLGNLYTSNAIAARAQAAQLDAEAAWEAARLRSTLTAQSLSWRAQLDHIHRLERDLLTPIRKRQTLLEGAWKERRVPLERVLRGRRQLHEAEHTLIAARADLYLINARAQALARYLSTAGTTP
jgi:hypothetical protein